jgi:hypothetical protein
VIFPASAVRVTVCEAVTALTVATKFALVAFAATVTDDGTVTALLLLVRSTTCPLLPAGALSSTVQLSVVEPVIVLLVQAREVRLVVVWAAAPVPLKPTCRLFASVALLVIFNCPLADPAADGANLMVNVNVLLGLTLAGSWLWLVTLNDCPVTPIVETSTGAEPSFVTVIFVLALCPTVTEPNVTACVEAVSVPVTAALLDAMLPTFDVHPFRRMLHTTRPSKPVCSCCAFLLARKGGRSTLLRRARVTI